jgi:hypothetical protein
MAFWIECRFVRPAMQARAAEAIIAPAADRGAQTAAVAEGVA